MSDSETTQAPTAPPDAVVKWRCDGCGKKLEENEVEEYGDGHCHVVPYYNSRVDDWEPEPCGPVVAT